MSVARVQSKYVEVASTVAAPAFDAPVGSGNFIVVLLAAYINLDVAINSLTDDKSGTYTEIGTHAHNNFANSRLFYRANVTDGPQTITATYHDAANINMVIVEYSGVATSSPADGESSNTGSSTTPTTGNVVTSAGGLVVAGFQLGAGEAITEPGGSWNVVRSDGVSYVLLEQLAGSSGTYNPSWTLAGSADWAAVGAGFKVAASAAKVIIPPSLFVPCGSF